MRIISKSKLVGSLAIVEAVVASEGRRIASEDPCLSVRLWAGLALSLLLPKYRRRLDNVPVRATRNVGFGSLPPFRTLLPQ